MFERSSKWVWVGLGVAAGAGIGYWLAKRLNGQAAAGALPQMPTQVQVMGPSSGTDGLAGMGAPPQPQQLVESQPRPVENPEAFTGEPEWTQNEEF